MNKNKLFLIAGHHNNDSGAVSNHSVLGKIKEAELTKDLRELMFISLKNFNPQMDIWLDDDNWTLPQVINWVNQNIKEGDMMIDIHFNAFSNPNANGTETLVRNGSSQSIINRAGRFSKVMADTLQVTNRGVKTEAQSGRSRIGILHGIGDRFLWEIKFLSNDRDVNQYQMYKHIMVDGLTTEIERQFIHKL